MTEQADEKTTTVYARVQWTDHRTQTTVGKGDPVQVNEADVDRLVRYGLVFREKSRAQSTPEPQDEQDPKQDHEPVPEPVQDPEPVEPKTEQHTAHPRRSRAKD